MAEARSFDTLPLSRLVGGVHAYDQEAAADQCVEALDVVVDDGDLRRRDAFMPVASSAPFILPAGLSVAGESGLEGAVYHDRQFTMAAGAVVVYIGCEERFDGIDWRHVTQVPSAVTGHRILLLRYYTAGTGWLPWAGVVDTTRRRFVNGSDVWFQTLCQDGRISWPSLPSSGLSRWSPQTLGGRQMYVVELTPWAPSQDLTASVGGLSGAGSLTLAAPGPRPFILEPVRSIIPYRSRAGRRVIVVGSDRATARGSELGAKLGFIDRTEGETKIARLTADEGAGLNGEVTYPAMNRAAPGEAWPAGAWTLVSASPGSAGTPATMTKNRLAGVLGYDWIDQQFRGSAIIEGIVPTAPAQTTYDGSFGMAANNNLALVKARQWEHYRLRCTANGSAAGTPVGEEREIIANTAAAAGALTLRYAEPFSIAPDVQNTFSIITPHQRLRLDGSARSYEVQDVNAAVTDGIQVTDGRDYEPSMAAEDDDRYCLWTVEQDLEWLVRSGDFWCACYDSTTHQLLLTNGHSGILAYDGITLRRLQALSDPLNIRVQAIVGALPDQFLEGLSPHELAGSYLRKTCPRGRFVVEYKGHTVVLNLPGKPHAFEWSAVVPNNDIWPLVYANQIRDGGQSPISGAAVAGDTLYIFTATSIHACTPPDGQGLMPVRPVHAGMGFVSHRSVAPIGGASLIGATADGVYVWDGFQLVAVLDEWETVVPGGVNKSRLHQSAGAYSLHQNSYFLAVPSAGSDVNDRILVYDRARRRWWAWSVPFGGCGDIARDFDDDGNERILFGLADGNIYVLKDAELDGGSASIAGYAKSASITLPNLSRMNANGVYLQAERLGTSRTMIVSGHFDGAPLLAVNTITRTHPVATTAMVLGAALVGTGVLAGQEFLQQFYAFANGFDRGESFSYRVRSLAQWRLRRATLKLGRNDGPVIR